MIGTNIPNTMQIPNLKLFSLIFCAFLFFTSVLMAQEESLEMDAVIALLDAKEGGGGAAAGGAADKDGYKSFVQNEFQNIFSNIKDLNDQEVADITFAEINNKRIEYAIELCQRDQRACFLIDEYQSYKSAQDIPKEFEALKLFGHDIFSGYSNEFNFYDSLPINDSYIIKIGDELKISLFGGFNAEDIIEVDKDGSIIIPDIGKYQVAGLSFSEISTSIKKDITNKFAGTEVFISLSSVRAKQVFALGNVRTPGTYALNAFGTALNALISSGGVNDNSSLRSIKVVRGSEVIKNIDLYDLLINGDIGSADFVLNDGDSILIGGLQSSVSIIGEVIRPAIYEIQDNQTLAEVINFALGTTAFADNNNISVKRLLPSGEKIIIKPKDSSFILKNGDKITVNASDGQTIQSIELTGAIRNAGDYSIKDSLTLGSIIDLKTDLLEDTYTGLAIIKRLNFTSKSYRLVLFNLSSQPQIDELNLYAGDKIFIFSQDDIKYTQSSEVYNYLRNQLSPKKVSEINLNNQISINQGDISNGVLTNDSYGSMTNVCLNSLDSLTVNPISNFIKAKLELFPGSLPLDCPNLLSNNPELVPILIINSIPVVGNVRFPGLYPTTRDLNALEIFNLAGGPLVSKLNTIPRFDVGIRARGFGIYSYEELNNLTNISMLNLQIDESSIPTGFVTLRGEFMNPGSYQISEGDKLSDIYNRTGGLTSEAYPLAGILTRESIKKIEQDAIKRSKAELSQIMSSAVASGLLKQNSTDLIGLIGLMTSLDDAQAVGRLVTELNPNIIQAKPLQDITLHDGDVIYIPTLLNTVTIVGQVLNPVTVPHKVGADFDYYIKLAGGIKKEADKAKIYVLQPNGISLRRKNGIQLPVLPFMPFERDDILPGGTLIVPRKARALDSLALVETITPVLANLSVTAASIAAISDN